MIYQLWYGTSGRTFPFDKKWLNERTWAMYLLLMFCWRKEPRNQQPCPRPCSPEYHNFSNSTVAFYLLRYAKCKMSSPTLYLTIQFVVVTHANHLPIGISQTENWTEYAFVLQGNTLRHFYRCNGLSMWYWYRWVSPNCVLCGVQFQPLNSWRLGMHKKLDFILYWEYDYLSIPGLQ